MYAFIKDESGAVTADWVVLTAGLVGLGLAVMGSVSAGSESTSEDIDRTLRGVHITTAFQRVFSQNDFSDGRGDWVGGELRYVEGFGEILALSGRHGAGQAHNEAELPINIGSQHRYAVVEFDMIIADSWDNEEGEISINGHSVLLGEHHWRNDAPDIQVFEGENETSVTLTRVSTGTGGTWRPGQEDYTYKVRVVSANDGSDLLLGASTTLDQYAGDEFFGIDNVEVIGSNSKD